MQGFCVIPARINKCEYCGHEFSDYEDVYEFWFGKLVLVCDKCIDEMRKAAKIEEE